MNIDWTKGAPSRETGEGRGPGPSSESGESAGDGTPLSEESEREILEMVEEQLARPNPPDVKVLYRRAIHFVDEAVRELSLQQFNAKFPLQVKRRNARIQARDGSREPGGTDRETADTRGEEGTGQPSVSGDTSPEEADPTGANGAVRGDDRPAGQEISWQEVSGSDDTELRHNVRSSLLEYAKLVATADSRADLVEAVSRVDEYVDQVLS